MKRIVILCTIILLGLMPVMSAVSCRPRGEIPTPAPTPATSPPAVETKPGFEVSSLTISPDEVAPGQEATVSATVENVGRDEGIYKATLIVDGEIVDTEAVSLASGSRQTISLVLVKDEVGTYSVEIGGLKGILKVVEPAVFEVTSLTVSPAEVGLREKAIVTAVIENVGQATGDYSASLTINGVEVETKDITLPGGTRSKETFTIVKDRAGTYEVKLGDVTATLEVKPGFYRNTTYGFSTKFPESWTWLETGKRDPVVEMRGPNSLPIASIYLESPPEPISLADLGASTANDIRQAISGSKVLSQGGILLADSTPAYRIVFTFSQSGVDLTGESVLVMRGKQVFDTFLIATKEYFDTNKSTIDEFFANFRLEEPKPFGVVRQQSLFLLWGEIVTLDPALGEGSPGGIIGAVFSGLTRIDRDLKVVPDIAERWEVSDDGKTYTFYLRDGVKFHNGKTITARDFKYSWERACDPETESKKAGLFLGDIVGAKEMLAGEATELSGVKVIDDRTLEVTIDGPKPYFLDKLAYITTYVVDRGNIAQGKNWTDKPNGTGPFKLKEWKQDELLILERNDEYYLEPAKLENVVLRIFAGLPMMMYEQGEIDETGVALSDLNRVLDPADPLHQELLTTPSINMGYLGFNVTMPPFDDPKVRRAFALALDMDKILEVSMKGNSERAGGFVPPGIPGHNEELEPLPFDPEQAKQLIAESKYGGVTNLPPIVLYDLYSLGPREEAMIGMLQQNLGVNIEAQIIEEPKEWLERAHNREFQIFFSGWGADYIDPQNFLEVLFHSQSEDNLSAYSNSEVDAALEKAAVEQDEETRLKMYQDIEKIILEDLPVVPFYQRTKSHVLVKPYVDGYYLSPMGIKNTWVDISMRPH